MLTLVTHHFARRTSGRFTDCSPHLELSASECLVQEGMQTSSVFILIIKEINLLLTCPLQMGGYISLEICSFS